MSDWNLKEVAAQIRQAEFYTACAILGAFADGVRNQAMKEAYIYIRFGPAPRKAVRKAKKEMGK